MHVMKTAYFRVAAAMAAIAFASFSITGCGPEEQPAPSPVPTPAPTPTPSTVSVTGISLDKTSLSLLEGNSDALTATVSPDNATDKSVSWKSSDPGIASVDDTGKVTAVKEGTVTITATTSDGSKTVTCTVKVEQSALKKARPIMEKIYEAWNAKEWNEPWIPGETWP